MIRTQDVLDKGLKGQAMFEWQKVSKAIKIAKLKLSNPTELPTLTHPLPFNPFFHTKKEILGTSMITQKRILQEIASAGDYKPNGTQIKVSEALNLEEEDFSMALANYKKDNPCTWKQKFQCKLLSGLVYTNTAYKGMGRKSSAKCTFCDESAQTFVHMFIECPKEVDFRRSLAAKWSGEVMDKKRWFLGSSITNVILEKSKNIIAKEANHHIFKMNGANEQLSVDGFKRWLKSDEEPEEALSQRINKVFDHHIKWSHIQLLLT